MGCVRASFEVVAMICSCYTNVFVGGVLSLDMSFLTHSIVHLLHFQAQYMPNSMVLLAGNGW